MIRGSAARRAAVVGSPVAHSLSPVLHRAAYEALGLTDWSYEALEIPAGGLAERLAALDETWVGLSVTMPHKSDALGLADVRHPLAEVVGAANTLLMQPAPGGRLVVAANTDVAGIVAAVTEVAGGRRRSSALVLGAGGTAAAGLAALAELGVTDSAVCVRSRPRAAALVRAAHRMGVAIHLHPWEDAADLAVRAEVVLQTAPAGAADALGDALAASGVTLGQGQTLLEAIYAPWPTRLAAAWEGAGGVVAPGWLMLLHQATEQVRLMTGREAPVEQMRAALLAAL